MATQFEELFQREKAFWQVDGLQALVDIGQSTMYAGLEAAFLQMWTTLVPGIESGFKNFMGWLVEQVPSAQHDVRSMADAVRMWAETELQERLTNFQAQVSRWLHRTTRDSARMFGDKAAEAAGKWTSPQVKATLRFDAVNRDAVDWAEKRSAALVTGIDNVMRRNISLIIANGQAGNYTPRMMAREIYNFIPLLPQHTAAVLNNKKRMLAAGTPLRQVEKVTDSQAHRYRRYRANNIARTETIMANNVGVDSYIKAKQESGLLPGAAVRVWIATRDDRTCPRCAPMHGKSSAIDGYWTAPGAKRGEQVQLPFPPLHPSCRCAIAVFIPNLHTQAEIEEMWKPIAA